MIHAGIDMPEWMVKIGSPESVEEGFEDEKTHYEANIKALIIRNAELYLPTKSLWIKNISHLEIKQKMLF